MVEYISHFSKGLSDLKQDGRHGKEPHSGTIFHALLHFLMRFVASVGSKDEIEHAFDWLLKNYRVT